MEDDERDTVRLSDREPDRLEEEVGVRPVLVWETVPVSEPDAVSLRDLVLVKDDDSSVGDIDCEELWEPEKVPMVDEGVKVSVVVKVPDALPDSVNVTE